MKQDLSEILITAIAIAGINIAAMLLASSNDVFSAIHLFLALGILNVLAAVGVFVLNAVSQQRWHPAWMVLISIEAAALAWYAFGQAHAASAAV